MTRFSGFVNVLSVNLATTLKFNKILALRNTMTGLFHSPQKITHNNIIKSIYSSLHLESQTLKITA